MHLVRFPQIGPADSDHKPGRPGSHATLPQVLPGPLLRICVSVLDTLMQGDQLAGAHHPSVLEKLAFKLRYFREVNHPGEASAVCSLFWWKEARSFGLELLSLQGGVGSPELPKATGEGGIKPSNASADASLGLNPAPSLAPN